MMLRRVGFYDIDAFKKLISSFYRNGFDELFPIPVDRNYQILDGSHRAACSLALKINPYVEVYNCESSDYPRDWFNNNGFNEKDLKKADDLFKILKHPNNENNTFSTALIWPPAIPFWNDILLKLSNYRLHRAFIKDFSQGTDKVIVASYAGDGMEQQRIIDKSQRLSLVGSKIGFVQFKASHDDLKTLKNTIREDISPKVENYFFDSIIHIIDNKKIGMKLIKALDRWDCHVHSTPELGILYGL